jgi:transposase
MAFHLTAAKVGRALLMAWMPPPTGIDLAKRVFQLHGACANGTVIFRKKLTRVQLLAFMSQQSACVVAMEACATAHSWGREFEKLGHTVRLIAPNYVKPFVKRKSEAGKETIQ